MRVDDETFNNWLLDQARTQTRDEITKGPFTDMIWARMQYLRAQPPTYAIPPTVERTRSKPARSKIVVAPSAPPAPKAKAKAKAKVKK